MRLTATAAEPRHLCMGKGGKSDSMPCCVAYLLIGRAFAPLWSPPGHNRDPDPGLPHLCHVLPQHLGVPGRVAAPGRIVWSVDILWRAEAFTCNGKSGQCMSTGIRNQHGSIHPPTLAMQASSRQLTVVEPVSE